MAPPELPSQFCAPETKLVLAETLGKRLRNPQSFSNSSTEDKACPSKRAKLEPCQIRDYQSMCADLPLAMQPIQMKKPAAMNRVIQSAPNSFNGSTNPEPKLDIQVSLPVNQEVNDLRSESESQSRKEKR